MFSFVLCKQSVALQCPLLSKLSSKYNHRFVFYNDNFDNFEQLFILHSDSVDGGLPS